MEHKFDVLCRMLASRVTRREAAGLASASLLSVLFAGAGSRSYAQDGNGTVDGYRGKLRDQVLRNRCAAGEPTCSGTADDKRLCCFQGQTCCFDGCCTADVPTCCGSRPSTGHKSFCCRQGDQCCDSQFVNYPVCCPSTHPVCCLWSCCAPGYVCIFTTPRPSSSFCCPEGRNCQANSHCCRAGEVCRREETALSDFNKEKCCPSNSPALCGGVCCKPGQRCNTTHKQCVAAN